MKAAIQIKRVYEAAVRADGKRYLVDGMWPRGISKEEVQIEAWLREVAPSTALRRWFDHKPDRWPEFLKRYTRELDGKPESWQSLLLAAQAGPVTLVYAARDAERNNAQALRRYLRAKLD